MSLDVEKFRAMKRNQKEKFSKIEDDEIFNNQQMKKKDKMVYVRLDSKLENDLNLFCNKNGFTRSSAIRFLLKKSFKQHLDLI